MFWGSYARDAPIDKVLWWHAEKLRLDAVPWQACPQRSPAHRQDDKPLYEISSCPFSSCGFQRHSKTRGRLELRTW